MTITSSFNGWHRLWIVISTIYGLAVAVVAVNLAPKESEIQTRWVNAVFQELESSVERDSGRHIPAGDFRAAKDFIGKSDEEIARLMTARAKSIDTSDAGKENLETYKAKIAEIASRHEFELADFNHERIKHSLLAVFFWIGPADRKSVV